LSFFETECPTCGERYYTGVVGSTLMGWHECAFEGFWPMVYYYRYFVFEYEGQLRKVDEVPPGTLTACTWPMG